MSDFFLVAGGTGGHVFPALALARELQGRKHSVRMITDRRGQKYCTEIAHDTLAAKAVLGRNIAQRFSALLALGFGYVQAHLLLWRHKPKTVVGFGGYAALPMLLAAQHQGRRTIVHEQNAVMGRVNRLLARRAELVALSFAQTQKCPSGTRLVHVGNPASGAPVDAETSTRNNHDFHLLVLGGSLGAKVFDSLIIDAIKLLPEATRMRMVIVQQTVGVAPSQLQQAYQDLGVRAECLEFIAGAAQKMPQMQMIITRAGGGITAEVSNAGLPALYVPLPIAADQHQYYNALYYADAGGAEVLPQVELDAKILSKKLEFYVHNPDRLVSMSRAMIGCAMPKALETLTHHTEQRNFDDPTT